MYRDVKMDLRPKGSDFVFEVQLTLTGVFLLKKSEQKIYTLMRMASAEELRGTHVFSMPPEDSMKAAMQGKEKYAPLEVNDTVIAVFPPMSPGLKAVLGESGLMSKVCEEASPHKEPEIIQADDTVSSRFMRGIRSCACQPCEPASEAPVLVAALPSRDASSPRVHYAVP
jgi:hypothetical protein